MYKSATTCRFYLISYIEILPKLKTFLFVHWRSLFSGCVIFNLSSYYYFVFRLYYMIMTIWFRLYWIMYIKLEVLIRCFLTGYVILLYNRTRAFHLFHLRQLWPQYEVPLLNFTYSFEYIFYANTSQWVSVQSEFHFTILSIFNWFG